MGTTPLGLPYPEPTDPVAQGADAIRRLAVNLERQTQVGSVAITGDGTNTVSRAITFPIPFAAAPIMATSISNWNWNAQAGLITPTGCTFQIGRRDAQTFTNVITVSWIAVGLIVPT